MLCHLFPLALQSTLRKRRSSMLTFLVLLLSFSAAIVSVTLTQSLYETNRSLRLNTYGAWYLAIPDGHDGDAAWLASQPWAAQVSATRSYGTILKTGVTFGTVDDAFFDLSRTALRAGRLPEAEGEVALTEQTLERLGCGDAGIGETITFSAAAFYRGSAEELAVGAARNYTLAGILRDYGSSWDLFLAGQSFRPVSAIMTEETANAVYASLRATAGTALTEPSDQYYIYVEDAQRTLAVRLTNDYLRTTRDLATEDFQPGVNYLAYPLEESVVTGRDLYALLIAVVALAAVLCVYMMQLPAEVHSFTILRSIGITRPQLLALSMTEAALLAAPAMLLGVPLGAGLTKLALRVMLHYDDVVVQVTIPRASLQRLLLLWLAVIVLARLLVFAAAVRTPLTGRMQLREQGARRARRFRRALIVLLLVSFGAACVYTAARVQRERFQLDEYNAYPHYTLGSKRRTGRHQALPRALREQIEALPGIRSVESFLHVDTDTSGKWNTVSDDAWVTLSFDGLEEKMVQFYAIEYPGWAGFFALDAADVAAFESGETVLLCFPNGDTSVLPSGSILLRAYDRYCGCVGSLSTVPLVYHSRAMSRAREKLSLYEPYTVVCSEAYLQRFLATMEAGSTWCSLSAGGDAGYANLLVTEDFNGEDLSAGAAVKRIAEREGVHFSDSKARLAPEIEACTQNLILLYSCGGCVALVTLLLLMSALAMEAEQEKRSFTILRVIGMSKKQRNRCILGKALGRSTFGVSAGLLLYAALTVRERLERILTLHDDVTFFDAIPSAWRAFTYYGGSLSTVMLLAFALLTLLLLASLIAKRSLREGERLK